MPNLSETLGSLLKDIANSRVKSDLFSRDASLEYFRDPVLRLFPVPRVEIRSADLELTFAVASAEQKEVRPSEIAPTVLSHNLPRLRSSLLSVAARPARTARQIDSLGALIEDERAKVEAELDKRLEAFMSERADEVSKQLLEDPEAFAKTLGAQSTKILREVMAATSARPTFTAELQKEVSDRALEWAKAASTQLKEALARARAEAFNLDLAVTKDDLVNVPQNAIARVKVTVEIQNYEWVETTDENGQPVSKLVVA
ncbi:MAG TPA: hypothetical protein VFQ92_09735 [Blastocatellia bacterium]|nr:hypothetical protein [Blastocatellia bacterium]